MIPAGIYLHVPFCRRRCFYCHFFKIEATPGRIGDYLIALQREIALLAAPDLAVDTIYFGGGSPSLLAPEAVATLLTAIGSRFSVLAGAEVTIEANPEDLDPFRLRGYRAAGVNRLSLGVQSFAARDLAFLGRHHSGETASRAVEWAFEAGIDNLSLDFIIGLPGQSRPSLRRNFARAQQLGVRHLSVYLLEEVALASGEAWERRAVSLYRTAQELLGNAGYPQYEVSNFAAPGDRSRHNLKYWQNVPYLGLGPGASSYDGQVDRRNVRSLAAYHRRLARGELPVAEAHAFPPVRRRIATGLRTVEGVDEAVFIDHRPQVEMLVREGMLVKKSRRLAVPAEHFLLLNEILGYFF